MPQHQFKVGQTVRFRASAVERGASGIYKILALLPEERGDFQYRVENSEGSRQRVVWESQLAGSVQS